MKKGNEVSFASTQFGDELESACLGYINAWQTIGDTASEQGLEDYRHRTGEAFLDLVEVSSRVAREELRSDPAQTFLQVSQQAIRGVAPDSGIANSRIFTAASEDVQRRWYGEMLKRQAVRHLRAV